MLTLFLKYSTRGGIVTVVLKNGDDSNAYRTNGGSTLLHIVEQACKGKEKFIFYNYRDGSSTIELTDEQYKIIDACIYASKRKYYDLLNSYLKKPSQEIIDRIYMKHISEKLFRLESYEHTYNPPVSSPSTA